MKYKLTLWIMIVIVGIAFFGFYSCNKSVCNSANGKCKVRDPEINKISLIIGGLKTEDLTVEYYKSKYKATGAPYEFGKIRITDEVYNKVTELLKCANESINSFATVLYFDQSFSSVNQLNISNISAFSVYFMIKNETQMHHQLFILKDQHFFENKEFDIDVSNITVNQLSFQLNELIPKVQNTASNNKSYLILFKKSEMHDKISYGHDQFRRLYYKYRKVLDNKS